MILHSSNAEYSGQSLLCLCYVGSEMHWRLKLDVK